MWTHCRCETCRPQQLRLRRFRDAGYPISPDRQQLVAAGEAALRAMMARPWSTEAIASATGVPFTTLDEIIRDLDTPGGRRMAPFTARRLLTPGRPTVGYVPTLGPMRRGRALARIGWDPLTLAARYPIRVSTLRNVLAGKFDRMLAGAAYAIVDAYDQLHEVPGPSWVMIARVKKLGWAEPSAWAGHDIDDPAVRLALYPRHDAPNRSRREAARRRKDAERQLVKRAAGRALGRPQGGERGAGQTPGRSDPQGAAQRADRPVVDPEPPSGTSLLP